MTSEVSRMPAVSIKRKRVPFISQVSSITSRVVPAMSETIALSSPTSALRRVDLPAFGAPRIATRTPDFMTFPDLKESAREETRPSNLSMSPSNLVRSANSTSSSEKSNSSSRRPANLMRESRSSPISRENLPRICSTASLWAPECSAAIRSATASAWVKSSLPLRKAR